MQVVDTRVAEIVKLNRIDLLQVYLFSLSCLHNLRYFASKTVKNFRSRFWFNPENTTPLIFPGLFSIAEMLRERTNSNDIYFLFLYCNMF